MCGFAAHFPQKWGIFFLGSPLTSEKLGWDGTHVQYHRQPAWERPEFAHVQHGIVVVNPLAGALQAERTMQGKRQPEPLVTGSCAVIPANASHQSACNRESEYTFTKHCRRLISTTPKAHREQ